MSDSFYVISGCSGSGKSTLLAELAARGHPTVPEPGRIVVREQVALGSDALPWADAATFIDLVLDLAVRQYLEARPDETVFFDRSIIDAACGIQRQGWDLPPRHRDVLTTHRYAPAVFMAPAWEEIYRTD